MGLVKWILPGIIFIYFHFCGTGAELPQYIIKCQPSDKECKTRNINTIFREQYQGDTAFALNSLDPLSIGDMAIEANPNSPVNVDIKLNNATLSGGKFITVSRLKGFGTEPKGTHEMTLKSSYFTLLSDYEVNGKVLIVPVQGKGKSNITLLSPTLKLRLHSDSEEIDGQTHLILKNLDMTIDSKKIKMYFGNLFNGDKALGDSINQFINENWREIFNEMKQPILKALNKRFSYIISSVFKATPYKFFFN